MHFLHTVLIAFALLYLSGNITADTLILNDGRTYEGTVVAEDSEAVTFEAHHRGMRMTMTVPRSDIESLDSIDRTGASYVRLPIRGQIGFSEHDEHFVTAAGLKKGLEHARQEGAEYVVLSIDSGGGQISEMGRIIDLIQQYDEMTFVAHVDRALSAAAAIALACDHIVMSKSATIGAAVPWQPGVDGSPKAVREKFESAVRSQVRAAAIHGGHDVLLARGMMEVDIELFLGRSTDDSPRISDTPIEGGSCIKPIGRVLTVTADEASRYGLASVQVGPDISAMESIGIEDSYEVDDVGWHLVTNEAESQLHTAQRYAAREAYAREALPRVDEIQDRLVELDAVITATQESEAELQQQCKQELNSAYDQYRRMFTSARALDDVGGMREATQWYNTKVEQIKGRYQPQITDLRSTRKAAIAEGEQLIDELEEWERNIPPKP